jgi:hypothetical protein
MRARGIMVLVAIAGLGLGVAVQASPTARHGGAARQPGSPSCPISARVELAIPDDIDEVRAIVDASTPGAASAVTVLSGRSDRQLSAFGSGVWGLQLGSPLPAGRMIVSVEPVLDAPASACVDQIELLRRGNVVARVIPR